MPTTPTLTPLCDKLNEDPLSQNSLHEWTRLARSLEISLSEARFDREYYRTKYDTAHAAGAASQAHRSRNEQGEAMKAERFSRPVKIY